MDWKRSSGWFKPGHLTRRYDPGSLLLLANVSTCWANDWAPTFAAAHFPQRGHQNHTKRTVLVGPSFIVTAAAPPSSSYDNAWAYRQPSPSPLWSLVSVESWSGRATRAGEVSRRAWHFRTCTFLALCAVASTVPPTASLLGSDCLHVRNMNPETPIENMRSDSPAGHTSHIHVMPLQHIKTELVTALIRR